MPTHGVSVRYLKERFADHLEENVYTLCAEVVTATAASKTSFAVQLLGEDALKRHVKPVADVFVSYAWAFNLGDVIGASESQGLGEANIWMDVFLVNQHEVPGLGKEVDAWLSTFGGAVKKVVFVLSPWSKLVNAVRAWCV